MISYSNKHQLRKCCISLFFLLPCMLWVHSSPSFTVEVKDNTLHEFRFKRQVCEFGIRGTCCLCPAGERVEKQCTTNSPDSGTCVPCLPGRTYNSDANDKDSCEPCTHCDPKANLEEEKPCTITANTACRCKPDHYCDKDKESCRICHPCLKCDSEGIKVACTATNNTICNDKKPEGVNVAAAVLIPLFIILFLAAGIMCYFWRNKVIACIFPRRNGDKEDMAERQAKELEPLKGVDLSPHLPDIASLLGWKVVRDLALRREMCPTAIESHKLNHPGDSVEQTLHLLSDWVEREGSNAPETLIKTLRRMDKNAKAEKVEAIIMRSGHSGGNNKTGQV